MFTESGRGALALAAGVVLWLVISFITGSLCWLQAVVGLPCPGCGSVRAVRYLVHGSFRDAFVSHPLILVSLALIAYFAARFVFFKGNAQNRIEKWLILFLVAVYVLLYAFRMFLFFPHTEPFIPLENAIWRQVFRFAVSFFGA